MTERVYLTDEAVNALEPPAKGRRVVWDDAVNNFGVRITANGAKSFIVVKRRPGDKHARHVVLAKVGAMTLKKARVRAEEVLELLSRGQLPRDLDRQRREEEDEKRRAEERRRADTFDAVAETYILERVATFRTRRATERLIRRNLIARFQGRPVAEIARRDVVEMVRDIGIRRGKRWEARRALNVLSTFYNWVIESDVYGLEASPCDHINLQRLLGKFKPRSRVLSDDELRLVWAATFEVDGVQLVGNRAVATPDQESPKPQGYPFGPLIRCWMLTGQRRVEWARAGWPEIDMAKKELIIGEDRMKMSAGHVVPLTPAVLEILAALPRFKSGKFVFTTTWGKKAVGNFDKPKGRIDAWVAKARAAEGKEDLAPWTWHDLRRTVRTRLRELKVPFDVREAVIAHKKKGMEAVYDHYDLEVEKRKALMRWEKRLLEIVEGKAQPGGKVVNLGVRFR
jgi:hypothetical protein